MTAPAGPSPQQDPTLQLSQPRGFKSHTAASAAMLLMASSVLSGLLALIRIRYVNALFGAGAAQDAYRAADRKSVV